MPWQKSPNESLTKAKTRDCSISFPGIMFASYWANQLDTQEIAIQSPSIGLRCKKVNGNQNSWQERNKKALLWLPTKLYLHQASLWNPPQTVHSAHFGSTKLPLEHKKWARMSAGQEEHDQPGWTACETLGRLVVGRATQWVGVPSAPHKEGEQTGQFVELRSWCSIWPPED